MILLINFYLIFVVLKASKPIRSCCSEQQNKFDHVGAMRGIFKKRAKDPDTRCSDHVTALALELNQLRRSIT